MEDIKQNKEEPNKVELLTPVDKLYVMANKNPDIELLIKEFNLQII
jgi:hypothetical protein